MSDPSEQFIYSEELYQLPARVIVLLPVPWKDLSDDNVVLLSKILGSARLSLNGVQILHHKEIQIKNLTVFNPDVVISFGVTLTPSVAPYQTQTIEGITIIQSDGLSALTDSKKKDLWGVLKQLKRS